jgi:hypothetical protein
LSVCLPACLLSSLQSSEIKGRKLKFWVYLEGTSEMKIGTLTCDISACSNNIVCVKISYYIFKSCQIFYMYLTSHLVAHENELLHMQTQVGNQGACIFNTCQQNRK